MDYEAAGALLFNAGSVLLVKHAKYGGRYGIPGGKLRPGETPLMCALRECEEETGLRPSGEPVMSPETYRMENGSRFFVYYFPSYSGSLRSKPDEGEAGWSDIREVGQMDGLPNLHEIVGWGLGYRGRGSSHFRFLRGQTASSRPSR